MKRCILEGTRIWQGDPAAKDTYVDFKGSFRTEGTGRVFLRISADSNYTVWVNGQVAGFSGCADYPDFRRFDRIELTKFCREENELRITVWHYGIQTQTYLSADGFLIFDIYEGTNLLLKSDRHILSRINPFYRNGYCKSISPQLGCSFFYDATKSETPYQESVEQGPGLAHWREQKPLRLKAPVKAKITPSDKGYFIDLGRETVGFFFLEADSPEEQLLTVFYSERLIGGKVNGRPGWLDFSLEYKAKKGENRYLNTFRRIAGRYLFIECPKGLNIRYAGVCPTDYPLVETHRKFADPLVQKIYDTSVYTLRCCLHEHYEDCPGREQALYAMDSRNQMLCGYFAFRGSAYQRSNLVLISKGLRPDGLLSICFPAGMDYPIPFFSLVYVMQVYEYLSYTKDQSLLPIVRGTLDTIMKTFRSRIEENGLIASFEYPFWNFYEWTDLSHNASQIGRTKEDKTPKQYDLSLNCMYIYVADMYDKMTGEHTETEGMKKAIKEHFFLADKGVYRIDTLHDRYSQLSNSLALLAGLGDRELAKNILTDPDMIPVSLSMTTFLYDGLLKTDSGYRDFILENIKTKYKKMLDTGTTTFWENEDSILDSKAVESLCHGWSALPVYYFHILEA